MSESPPSFDNLYARSYNAAIDKNKSNPPDSENYSRNLTASDANQDSNISEPSLNSSQSQPDTKTDKHNTTLTEPRNSWSSQVAWKTKDLRVCQTSSSCASSDFHLECYERAVDKKIANFSRPIPIDLSTINSPGPTLSKNVSDSSSFRYLFPATEQSTTPRMLLYERETFFTPEPSVFTSESSQGISNRSSQDSSFHSTPYKPQQSAPLPTVGLHQEGSILTSAMNNIVNEAVQVYYAPNVLGGISTLLGARPNVSNSSLVGHSTLKFFRWRQTLPHLGSLQN